MNALALILTNLPGLITSANNIIEYIKQVKAAAQQSGEWTPELELYFQTLLDNAKTDAAWQRDQP